MRNWEVSENTGISPGSEDASYIKIIDVLQGCR